MYTYLHYSADIQISLFWPTDKCVKGCYAISVTGDLPQDITDSLQDKGVVYRSRDTSSRS